MAKSKPTTNETKIDLDLSDENKSFQERIDEVRGLVEENLRYTKTIRPAAEPPELNSQLKDLLEKNLKLSNEILTLTKKFHHWMIWQRAWGTLKFILIIVPLILGLIYLPPLLNSILGPYQNVLKVQGPTNTAEILQQFLGNSIKPSANVAPK
ncbi:MAG: hypothetical protein PHW95_05410 [Patescibacteria group bacterium]|nr:hypothetical protein [Patescibacteria group bacterium]